MQYLLLPFFLIRLSVVVGLSLLKMRLVQAPPLAGFILAILFLGLVWLTSPQLPKPELLATPFSPTLAPITLQPALTPEAVQAYQANLETWLQLYQLQPTHRDVLLNIAYLYQALGNEEKYQEFWTTAQALDPNHPAFQTR